jgi:hypothetical protein
MTQRTNRTEKLDLRLSRAAKVTLQAAATAERKSVSEFVLDTALREAEERLADRRVSRSMARVGTLSWLRSMRRRVVTRASSDYFASPPCSIPKVNRDAFASRREIAPQSRRRPVHLRATGA